MSLSGGPANWWFRIDWHSCTAVSGKTTVNGTQGYQTGTHKIINFIHCTHRQELSGHRHAIKKPLKALTVERNRPSPN